MYKEEKKGKSVTESHTRYVVPGLILSLFLFLITFFFPLCISIAILTVQFVPTSGEEKAWEFAGRVTSGRLTHLLGHRIGPRVRQLQRRRTARLSLAFTDTAITT